MEHETLLKITRKRSAMSYLYKLEFLSFFQGKSKTNSLRWNRLQICISSIESHLLNELSLLGVEI